MEKTFFFYTVYMSMARSYYITILKKVNVKNKIPLPIEY